MSLQPCDNGSQWVYSVAVKHIQEGLETPYTLEKCDFGNGCGCSLENIIPENARGMAFDTLYVNELTKLYLKSYK